MRTTKAEALQFVEWLYSMEPAQHKATVKLVENYSRLTGMNFIDAGYFLYYQLFRKVEE